MEFMFLLESLNFEKQAWNECLLYQLLGVCSPRAIILCYSARRATDMFEALFCVG